MPVVIRELVIKTAVDNPTAASGGDQIHIESFSWGVAQAGGPVVRPFDGRLLTAHEPTRDQQTPRGETTLGDIVIVKQPDEAEYAVLGAAAESQGGATMCFGDGSLRFLSDTVL